MANFDERRLDHRQRRPPSNSADYNFGICFCAYPLACIDHNSSGSIRIHSSWQSTARCPICSNFLPFCQGLPTCTVLLLHPSCGMLICCSQQSAPSRYRSTVKQSPDGCSLLIMQDAPLEMLSLLSCLLASAIWVARSVPSEPVPFGGLEAAELLLSRS